MKTKIKILFALIIMAKLLIAQNLIKNSGFEIADPTTFGNVPNQDGQIEKCKYWKNFKTSDWFTTKTGSVDFWDNYYYNAHCPYGEASSNSIIKTHDGSQHFAGFGKCEGVQTELIESIQKDHVVNLSFWYKIRTIADGNPINAKINIYLMKNQEFSIGGCSNDYNNSYQIQVDVNNLGTCEDWKYFETSFFADDDGYDWIFFRGDGTGEIESNEYVYLDDIELTSTTYCGDPCYPLQVVTYPEITSVISKWCVINSGWFEDENGDLHYAPVWNFKIKNADHLEFYVYDRWGFILYEKKIFDPNLISFASTGQSTDDYYQFVWNGIDNDNQPLPEGTYNVLIKYSNCHSLNNVITKDVTVLPMSNPQLFPDYNRQPFNFNCLNRCKPNFVLTTMPNNSFLYQASDYIEASTDYTVNENMSIIFNAGNYIKLKDGFHAKRGSNLKIKPSSTCNSVTSRYSNPNSNPSENGILLKPAGKETFSLSEQQTNKKSTNTNDVLGNKIKNEPNTITIFPNPNNGKFLIEINGSVPANTTVELRDLLGKTVYSNSILQNNSSIDLTESPAGIYFITVCAGKDCWLGKVVKE